jgi:MtrB/PioB family decaheme-associated outer membrane protein
MKWTKLYLASISSFAGGLFLAVPSFSEVEVGGVTIEGAMEVGGLPGHKGGSESKFNEYRDVQPNTAVVPSLELLIGSKDFYVNFDSTTPGRRDQNYKLRFGRYGLVDIEAEWDQIPHLFSEGIARTPFRRDGGSYHLDSKPTSNTTASTPCDTQPAGNFCHFLDKSNTRAIDLGLLYGIGRFKIRYTPVPGWTFSAGYWSQHVVGDRAFGTYFGPSPGNFNIVELPEPIDYQTHNIEFGGEYARDGWSVGLKYNASLFHNNISTLTWDNPRNRSGVGAACTDTATYSSADSGTGANRGPCRGRLDLYPSNQAHTLTLSGAATLPLKTRFMGTASYGWRLQDDSFLPFTINSAITQPSITAKSLDGDVRPLMINATLVNNAIDHLHLKAFYRLYDLDNRSRQVTLPDGLIVNDQGTPQDAGVKSVPYAYSKNTIGFDAGYDVTRWLSAKLGYGWERMHREHREVRNSDEHGVGPTVDIKPYSWLLFRGSYRHFWRNSDHYELEEENLAKKFDEANRRRDRASLFAEVSPFDVLTFHAGFEFTSDRYPDSQLGTQNDFNYSPSVGVIYSPLDWIKFFGDYNWERFDWRLDAIQRTVTSQNPGNSCPTAGTTRCWTSRGRDRIHSVTVGSDMRLIENVLGLRIQYGFSTANSQVHAGGATCAGCTRATDYPDIRNIWNELLVRLDYQMHKNVGVRFGYYFNYARERDFGVDIMKPWMGDVDIVPSPNANVQRSVFLGDRMKGPFTTHVGFVSLRLSF